MRLRFRFPRASHSVEPNICLVRCGSTTAVCATLKKGLLPDVEQTKSMGTNAERIAYFLGRKPRALLSTKTNAERIDTDRARARGVVASL